MSNFNRAIFVSAIAVVIAATGAASDAVASTLPGATDLPRGQVAGVEPTAEFGTEFVSVKARGAAPDSQPSWRASVTGSGRYVAFLSTARNLDPAAGSTHGKAHAYLRDLQTGVTTAVDVGSTIVFRTESTNILPGREHKVPHLYRQVLATGKISLVTKTPSGDFSRGGSFGPSLSADGTLIS